MPSNISTSAASRQKRYAARQKDGLAVLHTLVVIEDVTQLLLAKGFIASANPTREQLDEAFSKWAYREVTRQGQELWPPL